MTKFLILKKSQDSCTEANTPDHTVEGKVVDEEANANNNNNEGAGDSLLSNLFEKLFRLNQKLEVQEDDIFRLTLQVNYCLIFLFLAPYRQQLD